MKPIEVSWHDGDIAIVTLLGEHDLATCGELANELRRLVRCGEQVIVDLSQAEFIDSSVLNNLVFADRLARERGSHITLQLATTPSVRKTLELSGLLPRLPCAGSREQAIKLARAKVERVA